MAARRPLRQPGSRVRLCSLTLASRNNQHHRAVVDSPMLMTSRTRRVIRRAPSGARRFLPGVVGAFVAASISACAPGRRPGPSPPIGAGARYGEGPDDGVTLRLRMAAEPASARVDGALRAAGYTVERIRGRPARMRT